MPIFEVTPTGDGPIKAAHTFAKRAGNAVPRGMTIAVDVHYLDDPDDGWRGPLRDIAEDLALWGVPIRPVLHLRDSARRLAEARQATEMHSGHAVVRVGGDVADPDEESEARLAALCRQAGTTIEQSALILDFFEVRSERDVAGRKRWPGSASPGRDAVRGSPSRWRQARCPRGSLICRRAPPLHCPGMTWRSGGDFKILTSGSGTTASLILR